MLLVISPAKTLDETPVKIPRTATVPRFQAESHALLDKLRTFSPARIAKLMDISPELARLNHARYHRPAAESLKKPAIRMFHGEVYRGLDVASFQEGDLRAAQRQLRVLSGLYGVLRPMDLIVPHRLEMGTRLSMGRGKKDLYAFWGEAITRALQEDLDRSGAEALVNLASQEYFKSVRPDLLKTRVITPVFKERSAKGPRSVAVFAKHQRGAMARWVVRHRLVEPERLKAYEGDGYRYDPEGSTADEWLFLR